MTVRDEVCGMEFPVEQAAARIMFEGRTYYFCADRCRKLFQEHPQWYVAVGQRSGPAAEGQ